MKRPYWQAYWWRLRFRADGGPGWVAVGSGEFARVPDAALREASLDRWADALLAQAPGELDDVRGDLLLECFAQPDPAAGAVPVYSRRVRLPGPRTRDRGPSTGH